jgi:hypothetical protein
MRYLLVILFALAALAALVPPPPPPGSQADDEFVHAHPGVGEPLPNLTAYTADGDEFRTTDLRGGYAVLTFGCLT